MNSFNTGPQFTGASGEMQDDPPAPTPLKQSPEGAGSSSMDGAEEIFTVLEQDKGIDAATTVTV